MMYNLLWTSVPVMVTAVFDQDASSKLLMLNPVLYEQVRTSEKIIHEHIYVYIYIYM